MKNTYKLILFLLLITHASFGQDVKGYIKDAESKEALAGVNVFYKDKGGTRGTVSDINGYYELKVTDGDAVLTFSYLGYETLSVPVKVYPGEFLTHDVSLRTNSNMMDEVVVSVGRYEQKLSDITVSMELLKAKDMTSSISKDLTDVLKNISGVDVTNRQPSVRGGTGWTYGVGSRCLILVDGMSVLTLRVRSKLEYDPDGERRSSRGTERGLFRIIWLFCLEWFDSRENETPPDWIR